MTLLSRSSEHLSTEAQPDLSVGAYGQTIYAATKHDNSTHASYTLWRFPTSFMHFSDGAGVVTENNAWMLTTELNINGCRKGDHSFRRVLFSIEPVVNTEATPTEQEESRFSHIGTVVIRSVLAVANTQGVVSTGTELSEPLIAPLIIDKPHPARLRSTGGVPPIPDFIDKKITAVYPQINFY